jgi:hypothetical protein
VPQVTELVDQLLLHLTLHLPVLLWQFGEGLANAERVETRGLKAAANGVAKILFQQLCKQSRKSLGKGKKIHKLLSFL